MDAPWNPGDKAWKAERNRQWRVVQSNLALLARRTRLERGDFKRHKELFFEGAVGGKALDALKAGASGFVGMLHVFWIWYHPDPRAIDLESLRAAFLASSSLRESARELFADWRAAGSLPPDLFPPDYGMMGGREQQVVEFLCPGTDYQEVVRSARGTEHPVCMAPASTYRYCVTDSERELCMDSRFYPWAPGQFFWPQLSVAVEKYPDAVFVDDGNGTAAEKRHRLKRLIAELLVFDARTDASRTRESTVAMIERIRSLQQAGSFSGALTAIWQEAADEQDVLARESADHGTFAMTPAGIEECFGVEFPEDGQRARIARWNSA